MGAPYLVHKNREPILTPSLKHEVYKVINEIAADHEIYIDCINGVADHVHLLVRMRTDQSVADIVKTIKGNSWEYFKNDPEKYVTWQDGFAAFSVSPNELKGCGVIFTTRRNTIVINLLLMK